jgi:Ca-activated chloride channel homolog
VSRRAKLDLSALFDTILLNCVVATWRMRREVRIGNKRNLLLLISAILIGLTIQLAGQVQKLPKTPTFSIGVDVVFVKVSVTDPMNRYVTGLEKENFKVYEDNVEQEIIHFSQQAAPISAGIIFDVSRSMKDNHNIDKAKSAIKRFLKDGNPDDEYFLVTFNQNAKIIQTFTSHTASLQNEAAFQKAGGTTAIYDAVYMALDQIKKGKNEKKALILVTDGEDNSSRYSRSEVKEFAKESDVQIYAIGEEGMLGYGRGEINQIVGLTGGRVYYAESLNQLDYYFDLVNSELRNQYILGYMPTNRTHDGKWRQIKVRMDAPPGLPKLLIHAKEGYYAAKN